VAWRPTLAGGQQHTNLNKIGVRLWTSPQSCGRRVAPGESPGNAVIVLSVRLADFILANVEPILVEWESFARSIWPSGATADPAEVRDEAEDILYATAADMQSDQISAQQAEKSKGASRAWDEGAALTRASATYGSGRVPSGFELWAVVAEYRALRASVLHLWRESGPTPDLRDVDDVTRFNESIDQSLTQAQVARANPKMLPQSSPVGRWSVSMACACSS
jgi:hypothetical protein